MSRLHAVWDYTEVQAKLKGFPNKFLIFQDHLHL